MDSPDFWDAGKPSPTRRALQGPRPAPLKVSKESSKIKKPPVVPRYHQPPAAAAAASQQIRQPVIIYSVSPKVIHTTADDFMNLVQRLTGPSSFAADAVVHGGGDVSPAARLASIERTSPSEREREREKTAEIMNMVEGLDMGQMQGILSPAPSTLLPVPPGIFSPEFDIRSLSWLNDLSPSMNNNIFVQSPCNLFSAPIVSPSPSSYDLLSRVWDL